MEAGSGSGTHGQRRAMLRSSLGLLSPIKEERLKEGAAEDYDEEEEASTVEEGDDSSAEEDDEEQLLSADALRGRMCAAAANGRFQMLPVRGRAVPLVLVLAMLLAGVGVSEGRGPIGCLIDTHTRLRTPPHTTHSSRWRRRAMGATSGPHHHRT